MDPASPEVIALPPMPWWLDVITFLPLIVGLALVVYIWRHAKKGWGFMEKQTEYLDHQRALNTKVVDQNKEFEDLVANQYRETNARADRALAQSDEALKLHAAALDQLTRMNETLARVAMTLDSDGGRA
ncbi:MAG: hypothetical protein ACT4OU_10110 [Hyphomicrobium sp.]